MNAKYADIFFLPHPTSKKHPRMPRGDRAAQFSPFSALTGFEEEIQEAERLTDRQILPHEDAAAALDERLRLLMRAKKPYPLRVVYFKADEKKSGGAYLRFYGVFKKIDSIRRMVIFEDRTEIPIACILELDGDIFDKAETAQPEFLCE